MLAEYNQNPYDVNVAKVTFSGGLRALVKV